MRLGVPKEILENENRVAALPETVERYVEMGWEVHVETAAGEGALRSDQEYEKVGAIIEKDVEKLFSQSDLILKVKQPCINEKTGKQEAEMIREGAVLIAFLHPAAPSNHDIVRMLRDRNITSLTMDDIPRIPRAKKMDPLMSMSQVTGYKSVLIAANRLPKLIPEMSTSMGETKPAAFLVVGAGVVGREAIITAKRLGGIVKAVDTRVEGREAAGRLGAEVAGVDVPAQVAVGEGGKAGALPSEWLQKVRDALASLVREVDVVICSALVPGERAPVLITKEMVSEMKPGSVIVDVSVDQGGNCEATIPGEEVKLNGVTLCGRMNIPGSLPVHASWLYANNVCEYVQNLYKKGIETLDLEDEIVQHSLVTHQGNIVHKGALKAMGEG